jgi:predicted nucleic acid-binding Zn ribbon protein
MIYEYYCPDCGIVQEYIHGMTEEPDIYCENNHEKVLMKKLISGGSGVIYNGVGWPRKGTGTAPKPKRYKVHELRGPRFLKNAIREN